MLTLSTRLWADELGASLSTEMALVTGVTVGALIMGTSSFTQVIQQRFDKAAIRTQDEGIRDTRSLAALNAEEKEREQARVKQAIDKREQIRRTREEARARAAGE